MMGVGVDTIPIPKLQNILLLTVSGRKGARMAWSINSHAQVQQVGTTWAQTLGWQGR